MEVLEGEVNFMGSLPRSENNVFRPMLHPVGVNLLMFTCILKYAEKSKIGVKVKVKRRLKCRRKVWGLTLLSTVYVILR